MSEIKKALKNFLLYGSLYNTVITTAFILIGLAGTGASAEAFCPNCGIDMNALHIVAEKFLTFLILAFSFSLGTAISHFDGISKVASVFAHAGCYIVGFVIFMAAYGYKFAMVAIATAIFAIVYVIERVIQHFVVKACKKNSSAKGNGGNNKPQKPQKQAYTSQFSK